MKTRLFKKPDFRISKVEATEETFKNVQKLEELKQQVKPEAYLQTLYSKISEKEQELRAADETAKTTLSEIATALQLAQTQKKKEIDALEGELTGKRQERAQLERPLIEKRRELNEQERKLNVRSASLDEKDRKLFEREHDAESKLESVRDMADELGEKRLKLSINEKLLESRQSSQTDREAKFMAAQLAFKETEAEIRNVLQTREYEIALRELEVEGKLENLVQREQQLSNGLSWLKDQRDVLNRAWNESKRKGLIRN